jgi:hypothetical protein
MGRVPPDTRSGVLAKAEALAARKEILDLAAKKRGAGASKSSMEAAS